MFERFTKKAKRALALGQDEAREAGQDVRTEHLLLGLLVEGEGIAAAILGEHGITADEVRERTRRVEAGAQPDPAALGAIGIDLDSVREAVEDVFGVGALESTEAARRQRFARPATRNSPRFTPGAKRLLELSLREALQLGHNYIGTEHLLMAATRSRQGLAGEILRERGLTLEDVREKVVQKLSGLER